MIDEIAGKPVVIEWSRKDEEDCEVCRPRRSTNPLSLVRSKEPRPVYLEDGKTEDLTFFWLDKLSEECRFYFYDNNNEERVLRARYGGSLMSALGDWIDNASNTDSISITKNGEEYSIKPKYYNREKNS
jgi:hypothetical protein